MDKKEMMMLAGGALILFFMWYIFLKRSSYYTSESFDGMSVPAATEKFVTKTSEISNEMKNDLKSAIESGKSKTDLIAISDKYSDYSADLNKQYSRFHINNMPIMSGLSKAPAAPVTAQAPAPVTVKAPVMTQAPPQAPMRTSSYMQAPMRTSSSYMRT
jgi:hypothetical protein